MKLMHTREAFGEVLVELGEESNNIVVLEADISTSTKTEYFAKRFPNRFFNTGIAEQNEMGIAAGLAVTGKIPFVSTYSVFASMRACEQVRTSIAYPRLNVKIAVSHGGLTAASDGATHQGIECLGIMRTIPNMTVIMPADAIAVKKAVRAAIVYEGPVYLQFTRDALPVIYNDDFDFTIGKANTLRKGNDITIIALGDMVSRALEAAEKLKTVGIEARVIDMHTIKPIDREIIIRAAEETKGIVTVEDQNIINGLGSAVAEVIVESKLVPMERVGIKDTFAESGRYEELLNKYGLSIPDIVNAAERVLERKTNTD
ncbi:MAG: transketolase family protein [Spirochaetales bacterium]|nr:transketolase family protein [Spirochaetales bacterium]